MACHKNFVFKFDGQLKELIVPCCSTMDVKSDRLFSNLAENIRPIATKSRHFTKSDSEFIGDSISQLLADDVIEQSQSPWRAQVHIVRSQAHKKRLVIDYSRTINKFTELDAYPLPRMDNLAAKISEYSVFSRIDLKSAYHQIAIHHDDMKFTAFEALGKLFQFKRLPFGLKNAVAVFQRSIDSFIQLNNLQATYAYLDDIIICGVDEAEHDINLQKFETAAKLANLTLNEDKCLYRKSTINFLGFTIANQSIRPDADRLATLNSLPIPKDSNSLQRTLGLFSYYAVWIPRYSDKIAPLRGKKMFPLSGEEVTAFETIKYDIGKSILYSPDDGVPLTVETRI